MDKKLKTSLELEVKELRARVEKLEALLAESLVRPKEAPAPVVEKKPEIAPEIILAISAAVAACISVRVLATPLQYLLRCEQGFLPGRKQR